MVCLCLFCPEKQVIALRSWCHNGCAFTVHHLSSHSLLPLSLVQPHTAYCNSHPLSLSVYFKACITNMYNFPWHLLFQGHQNQTSLTCLCMQYYDGMTDFVEKKSLNFPVCTSWLCWDSRSGFCMAEKTCTFNHSCVWPLQCTIPLFFFHIE